MFKVRHDLANEVLHEKDAEESTVIPGKHTWYQAKVNKFEKRTCYKHDLVTDEKGKPTESLTAGAQGCSA